MQPLSAKQGDPLPKALIPHTLRMHSNGGRTAIFRPSATPFYVVVTLDNGSMYRVDEKKIINGEVVEALKVHLPPKKSKQAAAERP